ncbi:MAG: hydrogenase maturation protease [Thermoanaerobacteraceae bacterium]|nr:hydrogenase maturation protease [Thermoanaerobacteraceae bacterium]
MAVKKVVIGLGNPILSDDGFGIFAAREVECRLPAGAPVDVVEASLAGLKLLDFLLGYREAVIIDSVKTGSGRVGEIYCFTPEALRETVRLASVHDLNLATTLELGRMLNLPVPEQVTIFAVEVADNTTFGEGCCREVAAAIPQVAEQVLVHLGIESATG